MEVNKTKPSACVEVFLSEQRKEIALTASRSTNDVTMLKPVGVRYGYFLSA
jgi:hypothetical protein